MGVVFQAEDPQLKRHVALKVMRPPLSTTSTVRQRFLREAQAIAALKHDHIVTIYQIGEDRGLPYLAMEFLEGRSLDRWLHERQPTVAKALRIGREIAQGLGAAHALGLIHRDIKPGNIWIEDRQEAGPDAAAQGERVKILDFGLAHLDADTTDLTQGHVLGTPGFMVPEQARSGRVDSRADLFSLGCVLYRMTTGKIPFEAKDLVSHALAVETTSPRPPRDLNRQVPPVLNKLILRLLAKRPGDRPSSAREVIRTLEAAERELLNRPVAANTLFRTAAVIAWTVPRRLRSASRKALLIGAAACSWCRFHWALFSGLTGPILTGRNKLLRRVLFRSRPATKSWFRLIFIPASRAGGNGNG